MKRHQDFESEAFAFPAVARATGPFGAARFLQAVEPGAVVVESEAGLIVVREEPGSVTGAGNREFVDYRTPRGTQVEALLGEYAASFEEATVFSFDSLPLEAARVVAAGLESAGIATETTTTESAAVVELPRSWDDFVANLGKKQRHEMRRKHRRYEESVGSVVHETHRGTGWAFEEFIRLHRLARGDKGGFMVPEVVRLFATLAWDEGWRIDVLRIPGTEIASACLFSYLDGDAFYLYNSSYDPDLADASPGMVLLIACIHQAIEMSVSSFDFLKGEEVYKYRLGAEPRALYEVTGYR